MKMPAQSIAQRRVAPWLIASATALVALIGALASCFQHAQAAPAPASAPVLTVAAKAVHTQLWPRWVQADGAVAAWQEASVSALVGGLRVTALHVDVGDAVHRGEVLADMDLDAIRVERDAASAELAQARVQAERARTELTRYAELHDGGAVSDQDWIQARSQAATTQAQVASAQARLQAKELAIRQASVVAPDDGVIAARSAVLGAVEPAGQELFRMHRRNRLQWLAEVAPERLHAMQVGQAVQFALPDGSHGAGRVARIAPGLSARTRLAEVRVDIDAGSTARAGMYLTGKIEGSPVPALVVPARSILIRDGHSLVAKLRGVGRDVHVELQRITTGRRLGNEVEALDGLKDGDRVVSSGADFLNDGDLVALTTEAAK